jgi:hypothetical protein
MTLSQIAEFSEEARLEEEERFRRDTTVSMVPHMKEEDRRRILTGASSDPSDGYDVVDFGEDE